MSQTTLISKALASPQQLTDNEKKAISNVAKLYPYFSPVKYVNIALDQPVLPQGLYLIKELYPANWLLLNEYLGISTTKSNQEKITVPEQAVGVVANLPVEIEEKLHAKDEVITTGQSIDAVTQTEDVEVSDSVDEEVVIIQKIVENPVADAELADLKLQQVAIKDEEIVKEQEEIPLEEVVEQIEAKLADTQIEDAARHEIKLAETVETQIAEIEKLPEQTVNITEEEAQVEIKPMPLFTKIKESVAVTEPQQDINTEETIELNKDEKDLVMPVYTEDYFRHQGVDVSNEIPPDMDHANDQDPKSLMVMMSFSEWLAYFKNKKQKEQEEEQEKKALRTMWQKEKLAAALEEESDEIPEDVFKMAVDSITREDGLVSESLAEVHYKQGRHDKAIEMYKKLSLRNPGKKVYFARKIEEILKNK